MSGKQTVTLTLEIHLPILIFDVDFRLNLINFLKRTHESRAYYMVYIHKIDYKPLLENELPLIKEVGDKYILPIPLDMEILHFKVNQTVSLNLILNTNVNENKINVFGENNYICCKINLNSNQIIEASHRKAESIKDNTYNKTYKRGDNIQVKITGFFNNQQFIDFSPKINCEGLLV